MTPAKKPDNPGGPVSPPNRPPDSPDVPTSVVLTLGDLKITIEGPFAQVLWAIRKLFGTTQQEAIISSLKVQWGAETPTKK